MLPWAPVLLAVGISGYFSLRFEPQRVHYVVIISVMAVLAAGLRWTRPGAGPPLIALMLVLAGVLLAGARAHLVAAPVLGFRYYGPIEGRVVTIDR